MRVLVVEDEIKMARSLRRGLEQDGYAVDVCMDGDEAFRRGLDNDYDAIVLDVMLPGRDGFAVCRDLRARGRWAPILMVTPMTWLSSPSSARMACCGTTRTFACPTWENRSACRVTFSANRPASPKQTIPHKPSGRSRRRGPVGNASRRPR